MPLIEALETEGFAVVPKVLSQAACQELILALERAAGSGVHSHNGKPYAMRNLLEIVPEITALARSPEIRNLVEPLLGANCFAVRGLLFDKTPEANWKVVWHQDVTIAVQEQREADGFRAWTTKEGVLHVQPPASVLERMVSIRLHLDDCNARNGPLRVYPGSHRAGRLNANAIESYRAGPTETTVCVPAGGALVMRPLLLHASSPAQEPRHRRVIHLDFACDELPFGLLWHCRS